MATIPPINAGPLKITFPANLPKNEKDLICMILAGRLKDLLNGKFICAQLAINDLISDITGVNPLAELKIALNELHSALDELKAASGADAMLGAINGALSQIENVFSLGGLCPSPIHAPKIPDVLKQLNNNLFGQTNSILNSLAKVSNPTMCLGGKPGGGLGIDWGNLTGDLANLKRVIQQLIDNPGNFQSTIDSLIKNLKGQTNRLKAELNRLKKNLADPFGVNDAQVKTKNIIAAKNSSDSYPVKTDKGIKIQNAMRALITPDLETAMAGNSDPIIVQTVPVLDYCGEVVGFERTSNVPGYEGYSTEPDALNFPTPTVLPVATYDGYDYYVDDISGSLKIYDSEGNEAEINIERGNHYRIGFNVSNQNGVKIFSNAICTTAWIDGITYNENPKYGQGINIITPDKSTMYVSGYIDWMVSIEGPTTPDILYLKRINDTSKNHITVSGITKIPFKDRTFDISNAIVKSIAHLKNTVAIDPILRISIGTTEQIETDIYHAYASNGVEESTTLDIPLTDQGVGYNILQDQNVNSFGQIDEFNKVARYVINYPSGYAIIKQYYNTEFVFALNRIELHISDSTSDSGIFESFIIKLDKPVVLSNMTSLDYSETYAYEIIHIKNGSIFTTSKNVETMTFSLFTDISGREFIRWNMTSNIEDNKDTLEVTEFIMQTDIRIDYNDISGTFTSSNPKEAYKSLHIKTPSGLVTAILSRDVTFDVDFGTYLNPLQGPYTGIGALGDTDFGSIATDQPDDLDFGKI